MFLGICSEWNLNFQNWSKSLLGLGVSEPTERLTAQSTAYAVRNWQDKQPFVEENGKRNLDIWMISSLLMTSHYLKVASYIQLQIIKPATVVKKRSYPEVIYKKGVLKNLQNSQENPCASISFLIKLRLKKRLWNRCFPVNIAKFLRTTFL